MDHIVIFALLLFVLVVLLIIGGSKLKFLSGVDSCEKQGHTCKTKSSGCSSDEMVGLYPCPDQGSDKQVCCVKKPDS